ncbi:MAG TPA: sulfotransferase [Thermomicrobiales bacterium]
MRFGLPTAAEPVVPPDLLAETRGRERGGTGGFGGSPRPVFVLGALRSGASLLTLSLGQHPNLLPVLETNWFERFGIGLQQSFAQGLRHRNRSQLDVAGIEIEDFFAHFGVAIAGMMLRSVVVDAGASDGAAANPYWPTRWVDGTPSNCFAVFVLRRLFPEARFVHVVRDLDDAVDALTTDKTRRLYRSRYMRLTAEQAYRHWLDTTRACLDAERAFGSAVVLRIRRDDLIAAPEQTLRHCLDFLGEPFAPAVLRPFSSVGPVERPPEARAESALRRAKLRKLRDEAEALNACLADGSLGTAFPEDALRIAQMEAAFSTRCERGLSAVPASLPDADAKPGRGLPSWVPVGPMRTLIDRKRGPR